MFKKKSVDLRREMPVLARHEGDWEGEYLHLNTAGKVLDRHGSHLSCMFPFEGQYAYYQINRYRWDDGKREELHFPAVFRDGRIWWDTSRIAGSGWEVDENSVMLKWSRKDVPNSYLYEMIQLSRDGQSRYRTWHWFQNGELFQRTIINERRMK